MKLEWKEAKVKLANLRDTARKHLHKINSDSGKGTDELSHPPWWEEAHFLLPHVKSRQPKEIVSTLHKHA